MFVFPKKVSWAQYNSWNYACTWKVPCLNCRKVPCLYLKSIMLEKQKSTMHAVSRRFLYIRWKSLCILFFLIAYQFNKQYELKKKSTLQWSKGFLYVSKTWQTQKWNKRLEFIKKTRIAMVKMIFVHLKNLTNPQNGIKILKLKRKLKFQWWNWWEI